MQTQPASAHTVTRGVRKSGKLTDVLYVQCDAINYGAYPTTGHLITSRTELVVLVTAESDVELRYPFCELSGFKALFHSPILTTYFLFP